MILYRETNMKDIDIYNEIPMRLTVKSIYKIEKINRGLEGFVLNEIEVNYYVKDFGKCEVHSLDTSKWAVFMAFDDEKVIGGAIIACKTKNCIMLSGRQDLAVLWDIRVDEQYKHKGVGQTLFDMALAWSKNSGLTELKIECQNTNVPAINFYHKQNAVLCAVDEFAYYNKSHYKDETQLIWYLKM